MLGRKFLRGFLTACVWAVGLSLLPPAAAQVDPLVGEDRERLLQEIAQDAELLERQGRLLSRVVRYVKPAVVHIESRWMDESVRGRRATEEAGSGVIVAFDNRPYVLTNRHVIMNSSLDNIRVKLADGRNLKPDQVWSDKGTDVAVLAIATGGLVTAKVGDSNRLEVGEFVIAVGSPFGLSHSVTFGIISAKSRRDLQLGSEGVRFQDFLQTDAAINPGNSGGPLLNTRGELIGMNTAIASNTGNNEGIGFAIPINMAMTVARQLVATGKVTRAYLGVHLDSKFNHEAAQKLGLSRAEGARVSAITPGSPAELARLQPDDVILRFDSHRIVDDNDLVNRVTFTPLGREVELLVYRGGKTLTMKVTISDRSQFERERPQ